MRDMYNHIPLPPPEVRVFCDCGHIFDVPDVEDGDRWDILCGRCGQYWDNSMTEEDPFPIIPVVGMRPFPERAKGALAVKTEFVETGSEGT